MLGNFYDLIPQITWKWDAFLIISSILVDWKHMPVSYETSHLGGKTSKFDTWNSDVWRHMKTCFERMRSRVDAIDSKPA